MHYRLLCPFSNADYCFSKLEICVLLVLCLQLGIPAYVDKVLILVGSTKSSANAIYRMVSSEW